MERILMYIPSIFKSVQQVTCVPGNNTIAATDVNYTELNATIASCNGSGYAAPMWAVDQNSATNLNVHVIAPNIGSFTPHDLQVVVREYVPFFFRRPFYHNYIIIDSQQLTGYSNTGIPFGPKAFVVSRGWNFYFSRAGLSVEITDSQFWSDLKLPVPSNGQVVATRRQKDYLNDPPGEGQIIRQGPIYHWYTVIDPW